MSAAKRKRLEEKGWKFRDVKDLMDLSPEEVAFIEIKLAQVKN